MRPWVVLVFFLLPCQSQGPSAVTPVFVQKGEDVTLNVDADVAKDFILVEWKFNNTDFIVKFISGRNASVSPDYTGRVEFLEKKFSVKLKNLQEADSGLYTARVSLDQSEFTEEYSFIVQDPVSPVNLTVDSRSSECNFNVTCRTRDSHINSTFRCIHQTCSQEGGEQSEVTASGASLRLYLSSSSIICNHSNQVSWTNDIKRIEKVCLQSDDIKIVVTKVKVIAVSVCIPILILIIIGVAVVLFRRHQKRGKYKRESIENTVYEIPQVVTAAEPVNPTDEDSGFSPTSTYCLVGPHSGPLELNKTKDMIVPESLYAQVEKPAKPANN